MTEVSKEIKELKIDIVQQANINEDMANSFIDQLKRQGKVVLPDVERIKSCRQILFCTINGSIEGIGAIKPATISDFLLNKSNLPDLADKFCWELGYVYVQKNFRGLGLSGTITRLLLDGKQKEFLMASTELFSNNPMVSVLQKNGFTQHGKPWKSVKHDGLVGLFLKIPPGQPLAP